MLHAGSIGRGEAHHAAAILRRRGQAGDKARRAAGECAEINRGRRLETQRGGAAFALQAVFRALREVEYQAGIVRVLAAAQAHRASLLRLSGLGLSGLRLGGRRLGGSLGWRLCCRLGCLGQTLRRANRRGR